MKLRWLVVWVVVCCGVAGCGSHKPAAPVAPKVVVRESVVATILTCVQENRGLSRRDQRSAYADLDKQVEGGTETDQLRLACLGLHERATSRQFRRSLELVAAQAEAHPDEAASVQGLLALLKRFDQERVARWVQQRNHREAQERLAAEKGQWTGRIEELEQQAEQDQARIKELQQQIEQVKNIENIIKNRER